MNCETGSGKVTQCIWKLCGQKSICTSSFRMNVQGVMFSSKPREKKLIKITVPDICKAVPIHGYFCVLPTTQVSGRLNYNQSI